MFKLMLLIQLITMIYHQITTLFDFFPFNGVRHYTINERQKEALINGIIMIIAIIFSALSNLIPLFIAPLIWTIILVGAIFNWWVPYLTGKEIIKFSQNETWFDIYDRNFKDTILIMPKIKNHPRPNLEHVILHTFILISACCTWIYAFSL